MKLSIPRFDGAHVLVVGDVMLDRYWHGSTGRISPEAPVPVVKVTHTEDRPGGAANVAINIAALGARVALAGVVGKDEPADILRQRLGAAGVACSFTVSPTLPTITKLRVISRHQQLLRMDFEDAPSSDIEAAALLRDSAAQLAGVQVMVLSDYAKGALADPAALIAIARKAGVPVLVDPKGAEFSRYRGATLLTPNLHEFETVVGHCATEHDLVERGLALLQTLHIDALLITRGEQGMTLLRTGERELHLPARAREVYDVTGAGDTVIAVLAAALAAGESLPHAVALANLGASIVVGKLGTASVSAPELRRAVLGEHNAARGVMTEEQLAIAISDAREQGERVVFTNGCFDILHAGHVTYLQEAAQLGDRLVVAVNNDDSVKRLKGEGRPINPVESRMAVLAGLESVAWVVSFADDTPERLLEILRPDILVKGGDYTVDQVVGAAIVRTHGGDVKVLSVVDNHSTTAIVDKIKSGKR